MKNETNKKMNILIINSGSSSLKYQIIEMTQNKLLCKGLVERIGLNNPKLIYEKQKKEYEFDVQIKNHEEALNSILEKILDTEIGVLHSKNEINAIGHRVVHGGEKYKKSVLIDDDVENTIKELFELAPLHNPANLMGIKACKKIFYGVPNVAVFDTSFHQTMPEKSYLYAIPKEYYEKYKIRRYGFHGTSHKYVSKRVAELMNKPFDSLKIVSCHLGNGASIAAINKGKVVDTSMGFTPLEGLVMGTRSGSIDPSIITFIMDKEKISTKEINNILNKKSGVLGLSGISSDMRDIEKHAFDDKSEKHNLAKTTLDVYHNSIIKYIGAYVAEMNGVDVIIFTGSVGVKGYETREEILKNFEYLGVRLDKELNKTRGKEIEITDKSSKIKAYSIPTNEELMIAIETKKVLFEK